MSRSRNGCNTCKRRHRKCDETRPVCQACQAQGLECEGYGLVLRWNVGVASRGHLTGVTTPVRGGHVAATIAPDTFPCTPSTRGALDMGAHAHPESAAMHASQQEREGSSQHKGQHDTAKDFFKENVYLLYSTHRNCDLPRLLYEMCQYSEAFCAIVAATQLYVANSSNPGFDFEKYYTRGLSLFRNQLDMYTGSLDASVLTTGLFICTLNLYQGARWSSLLERMANVYELQHHLLHPTPQLNQVEVKFALEAMAVMDLPTFVRGRHTMTIGIWAQMRSAQEAHNGTKPGGVETMSGLPRSLLDIFAVIQEESAEAEFLAWPGEVGEVPFCHLWEAYRLAGILTSRRLRKMPQEGGPGRIRTQVLVSRLIASLDALCETHNRAEYRNVLAANSIFYPYVAAHLELAASNRQDPFPKVVLQRVKNTCSPYKATANARIVAELLEEAFLTGDSTYDIDEQARRREVEIALF